MERLSRAGFTEAWCRGLLDRVVDLSARHAQVIRETQAEAQSRREMLAAKMRALADELESDQDAAEYYPRYGGINNREPKLTIGKPHQGALSLAEWTRECAGNLETGSTLDAMSRPLRNRHGSELKAFVIKGVTDLIEHYQAIGNHLGIVASTRAKNLEAALICSAVLGQNVTSNQISQTRRDSRRAYSKQ